MGCNGNCGSCGGCARELTLTAGEIAMLKTLAQIPFLPVARKAEEEFPVYREDATCSQQEYGMILLCLEKKGLIDLDWRSPLAGFSYDAYPEYPVHGTMALTQRGQQVVELIQLQGVQE